LTLKWYYDLLKVGEYLILHVRTNFYAETFNYIVVSKGIVLLTGSQSSSPSVTTLSIPLSAKMAPVSTVLIYHVAKYGEHVHAHTKSRSGKVFLIGKIGSGVVESRTRLTSAYISSDVS
jgi:hypothetical protein